MISPAAEWTALHAASSGISWRAWGQEAFGGNAIEAAAFYVVFKAMPVGMEHCFRRAAISYTYLPPGHADHPLTGAGAPGRAGRYSGMTADELKQAFHYLNASGFYNSSELSGGSQRRRLHGFLGSMWDGTKKAASAVGRAVDTVTDAVVSGAKKVGDTVVSVGEAVGTAAEVAVDLVMGEPVEFGGKQTIDLLNVNYGGQVGAAVTRRLPLRGGTLSTRADVSISCEDCYAHIQAGVNYEMVIVPQQEWPFIRVEHVRTSLFGDLVINAGVLLEASVASTLSLDPVTLIKDTHLRTIAFTIGVVPVTLSLYAGLQGRGSIAVSTVGTLSSGFRYSKYIEMGTEFRHQWGEFRQIPTQVFSNFQWQPLKATLTGTAAVEVVISPAFTIRIWELVPLVLSPELTLGAEATLNGKGCSGLGYGLYYSLALALSLDKLTVTIPVIKKKLEFGSPWLPVSWTWPLLAKTYPTCDLCSGCIPLPGAPKDSTYWYTGDWAACTQACGGGTRSRPVECRRKGSPSRAEEAVSDSECGQWAKPPASQACNQQACAQQQAPPCPAACTQALLGNDQCDQECMVAECGYDNGSCQKQLEVATRCLAATNCIDCLLMDSCGWCSPTARCMPGSYSGPFSTFTCSAKTPDEGWWTGQCVADEGRLRVLSPAAGDFLEAGRSYTLSWSGGAGAVQMYIRADPQAQLATGQGLPTGLYSSTSRSFQWQVPAGVPSSNLYQLVLYSATDDSNFGVSKVFRVKGKTEAYEWTTDAWGRCSMFCGGGTRSRAVGCRRLSDLATVADALCNAGAKPSVSESCNTFPCQDTCPGVGVCADGGCDRCSCVRESVGLGEFCGTRHQLYPGTTWGCDVSLSGYVKYQECCRRQGFLCDDGCTGKAKWIQTDSWACSKPCGGGTQKRSFKCQGYYNTGQSNTCYDYQCGGSDPALLAYECNTQPCPVYTWQAEDWAPCTRACATGTQTRVIKCRVGASNDTSGAVVADSLCNAAAKPAASQPCNTDECPEVPLISLGPPASSVFAAGASIGLTWSGGKGYGLVSVEVALVASPLSSRPPSTPGELTWQQGGSLPTRVDNTGSAVWAVPPGWPTGWYLVRFVSGSSGANIRAADGPIGIQGQVPYTLFLVPFEEGAALNGEVELTLQGALGTTTASSLSLEAAPAQVRGVRAFEVQGPDVGDVLGLTLALLVSAPALPPIAAVAIGPSGRPYKLSFGSGVGPGETVPAAACGGLNGSCVACAQAPGCGYCGATGECMPFGAGGRTPAAGSCPAVAWATAAAACPDRCAAFRACGSCLAVAGCGWCAESCSCARADPGSLEPAAITCPADKWLASEGSGGGPDSAAATCAPLNAGSACQEEPVRAAATGLLLAPPAGGGDPFVFLSGSGSTEITTCGAVSCGSYGTVQRNRLRADNVCAASPAPAALATGLAAAALAVAAAAQAAAPEAAVTTAASAPAATPRVRQWQRL
ncbi:hypothetical protein HYH03_013024 [Edaphochlamys debaryana]|uniref:Uncharacterized protein n=1 Tax=Edaphochlamys debaryana TaxID=47281 RepID=A0A836BUV1_9CHLO|nr:hypothetical protein HYH03_013024 [Edaphochlamys debaryana]|eukprot:KAG2488334.1 hypothetical protein HYH03_013024 [Edaphochlamys debaryana]